MNPEKKKIYAVKQGYNTIAHFESLDLATSFFAELVKAPIRTLESVSGKKGKAYFWGKGKEFGLSINEVNVYPSKEAAEFALTKNEGEDDSVDL